MIHFLVGKPRNGKSLRAMMFIWEELTSGSRCIITNMVLDLDVLQSLLIKRGFPHVDLRRRVRMLDDLETKNFWLYRPDGYVLPRPAGYDDKTGPDVDYSPLFDFETGEVRSVCYVIDEVHTHWRARGWAGTPRHVDFYNSQHGKLGDRVIFITQNTKLVDANFIRLAQDFGYCRNHRLEKHGRFRGDNKFTMHVYPGPVANDKEVTLNVETYKLDLELAECYDTSAGVGMPGGGKADAGFRAKGIPLWTVWAGLAAVLVVCWGVFTFVVPKFANGYLARGISGQSLTGHVPDLASPPVAAVSPAPLVQAAPASVVLQAKPKIRGYAIAGERVRVLTEFGETLTEDIEDGVESIRRNKVRVNGETFYLMPAAERPIPAPVPSPALPTAPAAAETPSLPPPPVANTGDRWATHSDGVSRLKRRETLSEALGL